MNDRKLIDYLPPVLQMVPEFMEITDAQQPEFEKAWAALNFVMDNQFIDSATEEGIAVWEKELNITPLNTETLEERKQRIKAAWTYGVVYTYNWLKEWLAASCGKNNPLPTLNGYVLHTSIPISFDYKGILSSLRRYVPANVFIDPVLLLPKAEVTHYVGMAIREGITEQVKCNVPDMPSVTFIADGKGRILVDGSNAWLAI